MFYSPGDPGRGWKGGAAVVDVEMLGERDDDAFADGLGGGLDDEAIDVESFDDVGGDGDPLSEEARAELEALAAAELDTAGDGEELQQALAAAQRELARQRDLTRSAVARYRLAVLAAEPELPPELVSGETLDAVDASLDAARAMVVRVRERAEVKRVERGFPAGAPARTHTPPPMTSREKIVAGLQERLI